MASKTLLGCIQKTINYSSTNGTCKPIPSTKKVISFRSNLKNTKVSSSIENQVNSLIFATSLFDRRVYSAQNSPVDNRGHLKLWKSIRNIEDIQSISFKKESIVLGFIGRSNVGKSSLLNAIIGKYGGTAAGVSPMPGFTRTINIYRWHLSKKSPASSSANDIPVFWIDMPGYGYASVSTNLQLALEPMVKRFIQTHPLQLLVLIDSRHGLKVNDKEFLQFLEQNAIRFQVIMTKCDLSPKSSLARICQYTEDELAGYRLAVNKVLLGSINRPLSIEHLRRHLSILGGSRLHPLTHSKKLTNKFTSLTNGQAKFSRRAVKKTKTVKRNATKSKKT